MKLDLLNYLPQNIVSNSNRKYELHAVHEGEKIPINEKIVPKDKMGLWYETKTPTDGRIIFHQILPRYIPKSKILFESIGLYKADGAITLNSAISFSNDEPNAINIMMENFRRNFDVSYSDWYWHIGFNDHLKSNETPEETKKREKGGINFWLKKTKIDPESASKTAIVYSNKGCEGDFRIKRRWGSLTINFGNRILKNIWVNLTEELIEETIKKRNKEFASHLLRGWIAGDGYCGFKDYGYDKRRILQITCKDEEDREKLQKLSHVLNLNSKKSGSDVSVLNLDGFIKSFKLNLTSINPYKNKNLPLILLSYSFPTHRAKVIPLKKEIKKELNQVLLTIEDREELFHRPMKKKPPKLGKEEENTNWKFIINSLVAKFGSKRVINEIGCAELTLFNWLNDKTKPSEKYRAKIRQFVSKSGSENEFTKFGRWMENADWCKVLLGLQIELSVDRKGLAKILNTHVNTIEPIINERRDLSRKTAYKILSLIERIGKKPKELEQLYGRVTSLNWKEMIRQILIQNEFSQRELAERLGCSRSLVNEWIRGIEPTLKYKGRLLDFFEDSRIIKFRDIDIPKVISRVLDKMSTTELAERLNVSSPTVRKWGKGQQKPQLRHMLAVSNLSNKI